MRVVDRDDVRVPDAQPGRRIALPGVGEPVDLGQHLRTGVADQQLEHASGADRGELFVVAGVEQFGPGGGDDRGDAVEVLGGAHPGLVDDDQVLAPQPLTHVPVLVGAVPVQEPAGVDRVDPVVDEHAGSDVRGRHTDDPAAGLLLPHAGQRPDRAGLPRPGRTDQDVAAAPGRQDLQHFVALVLDEPGGLQLHRGQLQLRPGQRGSAGGAGALDDGRFGRQLSGGGVLLGVAHPEAAEPVRATQLGRHGADVADRQHHDPVPVALGQHLGGQVRRRSGDRRGADLLVADRHGQVPDVPGGIAPLHGAQRGTQHLLPVAGLVALLLGVPVAGEPSTGGVGRGHLRGQLLAHRLGPVRHLLPRRHRVVLRLPCLAPRGDVHLLVLDGRGRPPVSLLELLDQLLTPGRDVGVAGGGLGEQLRAEPDDLAGPAVLAGRERHPVGGDEPLLEHLRVDRISGLLDRLEPAAGESADHPVGDRLRPVEHRHVAVQLGLLRAAGRVVPADPHQPAGLLVDPDRLPGRGLAVIARPHVGDLLLDVGHGRRHRGTVCLDDVRRLGVAPGLQQPRPVHAPRLHRGERQVVVGHRLALPLGLLPDLGLAFLGGVRLRGQRLRHPLVAGVEVPRAAAQRDCLAGPQVGLGRVFQPPEHRPHLRLGGRGTCLRADHRQALAAPHAGRLLLRAGEHVAHRVRGPAATARRGLTGVLVLGATRPAEQVLDCARRHRSDPQHEPTVP